MITQDYLKSILDYNPETGVFTWIESKRYGWVGKQAGSMRSDGYLKIKILNKNQLAHRLAYLYIHGCSPKSIDHINGSRCDNRIENLRAADHSKNGMNKALSTLNTSGVKGVSLNKKLNKWAAYISVNNKRNHLGVFASVEDAEKAITEARNRLHGEFANHGEFSK